MLIGLLLVGGRAMAQAPAAFDSGAVVVGEGADKNAEVFGDRLASHVVADITGFEVSVTANGYFWGLSESGTCEQASRADESRCGEENFFHTICSL